MNAMFPIKATPDTEAVALGAPAVSLIRSRLTAIQRENAAKAEAEGMCPSVPVCPGHTSEPGRPENVAALNDFATVSQCPSCDEDTGTEEGRIVQASLQTQHEFSPHRQEAEATDSEEDEELFQDLPFLAPRVRPDLEAMLPPEIAEAVRDISLAHNAPEEIPLANFLALASGLTGWHCLLETRQRVFVGGNLYLCLVAPSGTGKSPITNTIFKHADARDGDMFAEWKSAYDTWRKADPNERGEEPKKKQLFVEDITTESLRTIFAENEFGITLKADEIRTPFSSFGMYSSGTSGEANAKSHLLTAYDGGSWKVDRVDRSKCMYARKAILGIFGGVQPRLVREVFGRSDIESGLSGRFLFVVSPQGDLHDNGMTVSEKTENCIRGITDNLLKTTDTQGERIIHLSPEQQERLRMEYNALVDADDGRHSFDTDTRNGLLPKHRDHMAKMVLLSHRLEEAIAGRMLSSVSDAALERGLRLAAWMWKQKAIVHPLLAGQKDGGILSDLDTVVMRAALKVRGGKGEKEDVPSDLHLEAVNESLPNKITAERLGAVCRKLGFGITKEERKKRGSGKSRYWARILSDDLARRFAAYLGYDRDTGTHSGNVGSTGGEKQVPVENCVRDTPGHRDTSSPMHGHTLPRLGHRDTFTESLTATTDFRCPSDFDVRDTPGHWDTGDGDER